MRGHFSKRDAGLSEGAGESSRFLLPSLPYERVVSETERLAVVDVTLEVACHCKTLFE